MSAHTGPQASVRPIVTAVIVAHNGAPWLGELISGLRAQRRAPDRVVVVDTDSEDDSRALLAEAFGNGVIIEAPRTTGFGAAVARASMELPARQAGEWLWLLHDDCAPAPDALAALLRLADSEPSAAVIGPKLRDWPGGRRLLELGVTIAGSGNRETGLEFAEFDQGQHDVVRDVLAVSTAGMLVRRDVFERLGGFDERYGLFRDDVDFGWRVVRSGHRVLSCPEALVFHAEAGYRGTRTLHAVRGRPRRIDRRNAIHTLLVNCFVWMVPLVALRLASGSLLRVLGLLVAKWPDAAYDEFRALVSAFSRPDLIVRGRRWRAKFRRAPSKVVRPLLPPPWIGLQHTFDALAALVSARSGTHAGSGRRVRRAVETGPVSDEVEELPSDGSGIARWLLTRPPVLLVLALVVLAAVASRHLFGAGALGGGALLPAPDGIVDLWGRYVEPWHEVDLGSGRGTPPYVAVVAFLGTLLAGKAWLAVDLLVLGAVPLAGLTCYFLVRGAVQSRPVRLWATATYALLPAVTGAVAGGRLGTCVAIVVLPLVALAALRMVGVKGATAGSWSATWTTGLLLAVVTAFVPAGYLAALGLGIAACFVPWLRRAGSRRRVALALAVAPLALLPWLPTLVHNPGALLGEAGLAVPELADAQLPATSMMLASPGGPGAAPAWIFGLLLLVALTALLRRDHSRGVLAAWIVSLVGLALGLAQSRLTVRADWISVPVPSWPGFAAAVVALGWILAIAYAADGAARLFSERSFSWRQPVAGLLAVVAACTPLVAAGWWTIRGADGPLARDAGAAVPPYVRDALDSPAHPRALVVQAEGGTARYAVLRDEAARLGDAEVGASAETLADLDAAVGDLLSDAEHNVTADRLAAYAIGYVYLPAPADARSVERLDTMPGLSRASAPEGAAAWQVDIPVGALRVVPAGGASDGPDDAESDAAEDSEVLRTAANGAALTVPAGPAGRRLVLAEAYNSGWRATLDGASLPPGRYAGWAQSFDLPASGGRLVVSRAPSAHGELVALQGLLLLVFLIFALPTRARRDPSAVAVEPSRRQGSGPVRPDARAGRRSAAPGQPVGAPGATGRTGPPVPGDVQQPHEGARR